MFQVLNKILQVFIIKLKRLWIIPDYRTGILYVTQGTETLLCRIMQQRQIMSQKTARSRGRDSIITLRRKVNEPSLLFLKMDSVKVFVELRDLSTPGSIPQIIGRRMKRF